MVTRELVVDTSVAFKWCVAYGEGGIDEAASLLAKHRIGQIELIAPATILVEIANTLRYLLPADDALSLMDGFRNTHVRLFNVTHDLVRRATLRAAETGMGVYDALFLALAEERGCPLVTADRKAFEGIDSSVDITLL